MFLKGRNPKQVVISKPVSDPNQCAFTLMKSLPSHLAFVSTYERTHGEGVGRKHTIQYLGVDLKDRKQPVLLTVMCSTRFTQQADDQGPFSP